MTFNQFMHPRNIYRQKPNYNDMASVFPEFKEHLVFESGGKAKIDYTNKNALRCLTKTLLKKDFGLDVDIPDNRLIPTLPLRLNYILWIEDLLESSGIGTKNSTNAINGLDIGTGCCAIFPILSITLNQNWNFLATEIDSVNLHYAKLNVENNNLSNKIIVYQNETDTLFTAAINNLQKDKINFIMTNPPFFSDIYNDSFEEDSKNITKSFHNKKNGISCLSESVIEGGEVAFIKKMIEESFVLKNSVDIYTAMIGRKQSFLELKYIFKDYEKQNLISSFSYTELCQGNTKRWAIAWTFSKNLSKVPQIKSIKSKPLLYYIPSVISCCEYDFKSIGKYISSLFLHDLQISTFSVIETKKSIEFDIKSNLNTWKNQRKKRRQELFAKNSKPKTEQIFEYDEDDKIASLAKKRHLDEDEEDELNENSDKKHKEISHLCKDDLTYLLHCGLKIKRDNQKVFFKLVTKEMSQNKESTFQIFQYLKNKLI